ncbi:MAG: hypothetical protein KC656_04075 [Myxococcales bacterium]|nr:hypothetical protein [Myxococcales bacterium]
MQQLGLPIVALEGPGADVDGWWERAGRALHPDAADLVLLVERGVDPGPLRGLAERTGIVIAVCELAADDLAWRRASRSLPGGEATGEHGARVVLVDPWLWAVYPS